MNSLDDLEEELINTEIMDKKKYSTKVFDNLSSAVSKIGARTDSVEDIIVTLLEKMMKNLTEEDKKKIDQHPVVILEMIERLHALNKDTLFSLKELQEGSKEKGNTSFTMIFSPNPVLGKQSISNTNPEELNTIDLPMQQLIEVADLIDIISNENENPTKQMNKENE